MLLKDIALHIKGELHGAGESQLAGDLAISGVASIKDAGPREITFLVSADYEPYLKTTGAAAVILKTFRPELQLPQIVHRNPYWAFARVSQLFWQRPKHPAGISPEAVIAAGAEIDPTATVMALAYVGVGSKVGKHSVIYPGAYLGRNVVIGEASEIRANVVLEDDTKVGNRVLIHGGTVIGADGFGFAPGEGELAKIPQIGAVVIGDDVEVGASCTIDRGALEDTKIGKGTKLDSHVHVGHGVTVGENCLLCGMAGIAGSARLGNWVTMGGNSAINSKCEVPDGTQLGAMSGMISSPDGTGTYLGFPSVPAGEWRRQTVTLRKLPEMEKRLRALEAKLAKLTGSEATN